MFVCELVVLDCIHFYQDILEDLLFYSNPFKEYCTGVVSSLCKSIFALDKHCTKVVSYVQYAFVSWRWNNRGSLFLADFWSQKSLAKVKSIIT